MVWHDLGLNPGFPNHWWTLYPLGQWAGILYYQFIKFWIFLRFQLFFLYIYIYILMKFALTKKCCLNIHIHIYMCVCVSVCVWVCVCVCVWQGISILSTGHLWKHYSLHRTKCPFLLMHLIFGWMLIRWIEHPMKAEENLQPIWSWLQTENSSYLFG